MRATGCAALAVVLSCGLGVETHAAKEAELPALARRTKDMVEAAETLLVENAENMKAVQKALEQNPKFRDDENGLYIFMHAFDADREEAICIGQGVRPDLVGKNMWSMRSADGRLILQEYVKLFEKQDSFWSDYVWLNPHTNRIGMKRSYVKKVALPGKRTAWVGCGYWTQAETDSTSLPPMARKAKSVVEAAHAYIREHANDMKAVQKALQNDPRFRDDKNELYIFMHAYNAERKEAVCIGHGIRPELLGRNMWSLRTPGGRLVFQEEVATIQKQDEFWLTYDWLNPHTNRTEPKRSFFKKIVLSDGRTAWVGCGYWQRPGKQDAATRPNSKDGASTQPGSADGGAQHRGGDLSHDSDAATKAILQDPMARKTKAIVEATCKFIHKHSDDMAAIQKALQSDPRFRDDKDQLYIFMHAYNIERKEAICVGHGVRPGLLGKNMWSLRTPTGRLVFPEFAKAADRHDEFWLDYDWLNPHTNRIETKQSFLKKVKLSDGRQAWVGCGFWKRRGPVSPRQSNAAGDGSDHEARDTSD